MNDIQYNIRNPKPCDAIDSEILLECEKEGIPLSVLISMFKIEENPLRMKICYMTVLKGSDLILLFRRDDEFLTWNIKTHKLVSCNASVSHIVEQKYSNNIVIIDQWNSKATVCDSNGEYLYEFQFESYAQFIGSWDHFVFETNDKFLIYDPKGRYEKFYYKTEEKREELKKKIRATVYDLIGFSPLDLLLYLRKRYYNCYINDKKK